VLFFIYATPSYAANHYQKVNYNDTLTVATIESLLNRVNHKTKRVIKRKLPDTLEYFYLIKKSKHISAVLTVSDKKTKSYKLYKYFYLNDELVKVIYLPKKSTIGEPEEYTIFPTEI